MSFWTTSPAKITADKVLSRFIDKGDITKNNEQFREMLRAVSFRPYPQLYNEMEESIRGNPIEFILYVIAQDNRRTPKQILKSHQSIAKYVADKVLDYNPEYEKFYPGFSSYGYEQLADSLAYYVESTVLFKML